MQQAIEFTVFFDEHNEPAGRRDRKRLRRRSQTDADCRRRLSLTSVASWGI